MPLPVKYRRLLEASQRYNNFHRFVDLLTIQLFLVTAAAITNKFVSIKLIDIPILQWSWQSIAIAATTFIFLFIGQTYYEKQSRILSEFQKEAALKAARKNNFRRY